MASQPHEPRRSAIVHIHSNKSGLIGRRTLCNRAIGKDTRMTRIGVHEGATCKGCIAQTQLAVKDIERILG